MKGIKILLVALTACMLFSVPSVQRTDTGPPDQVTVKKQVVNDIMAAYYVDQVVTVNAVEPDIGATYLEPVMILNTQKLPVQSSVAVSRLRSDERLCNTDKTLLTGDYTLTDYVLRT